MLDHTARAEILADLRRRLRPVQPSPTCGDPVTLYGLLPEGLDRGTLVEWLGDGEGNGAWTLALGAGVQAVRPGGAVVVIDPPQAFYPPAAAAMGLDLERTLLLRPRGMADALWAAEQSLRSPGVDLVLYRLERVRDQELRRLQLAAEAGGALGFLIRPTAVGSASSWADVRLRVVPQRSSLPSGRRLRVELLRSRTGPSGATVIVDVDHETGHVHLAPDVASPAAARHTSRA